VPGFVVLVKEYFPDREIGCRCGCGLMPSKKSVERLYALRLALGFPLEISSGARCLTHNKAVGGAVGSVHLMSTSRVGKSRGWGGSAFDIVVKNSDKRSLIVKTALDLGFRGVGIGLQFIHIDDAKRPEPVIWLY